MKTKENKIRITLKTIIYVAYVFFAILCIIMFYKMYFQTNKSYAKEVATNPENENQKISQANQIDIEQIIKQNRRRNNFFNKQKLKEYINTKPF